ncbi:MAG TPA: DUF2017 family protein [Candidatus Dormibacteraeota bacterium]|nr:DUF2017 family protein [Candidatus Dormibacteraeota bacterium]
MASVRRHRGRVEVRLDAQEREAMLGIVESLAPSLGSVPRTTPRAYDDPELEDEYARLVRPEVEASRDADIEVVRESLRTQGERRELDEAHAMAWVRALNHLRLAAGGLLGVEEDRWDEAVDTAIVHRSEFTMLMALGWMQERIVAALEPGIA